MKRLCMVALLFAAYASPAAAQITIENLPCLPGHTICEAYGLNEAGTAAGVSHLELGSHLPVIWTNRVPQALPLPPWAVRGQATDINDSGYVVGDVSSAASFSSVVWANGTVYLLPSPAGLECASVDAVDNAGKIPGDCWDSNSGRVLPIVWRMTVAGNPTTYVPVFIEMPADAESADTWRIDRSTGIVLGRVRFFDGRALAAVWNDNGQITLLKGADGFAWARNQAGVVVGSADVGGAASVIWPSVTSDPVRLGSGQWAFSVNNSNRVFLSSRAANGFDHLFVWENGQLVDLTPDSTTHWSPFGLNSTGLGIANLNPDYSSGSTAVLFRTSGLAPASASQLFVSATPNPASTLDVLSTSATLSSGGQPVSGVGVLFKVDDTNVGSATTNAAGVAQLGIPLTGLQGGNHTVSASYTGGLAYEPSTGTTTVEVSGAHIERTVSGLSTSFSDIVGGLAYDSSTNRLYAQQTASGDVRVIDPDTGMLIDTLHVQSGYAGDRLFALDITRQRIYGGNNSSPGVLIYDAQSGNQVDSWPGTYENGVFALNPANGFLYHYNGYFTVFDPTKPAGGSRFLVFGGIGDYGGVAVDPSTNFVHTATLYPCDPHLCLQFATVDGRPESPSFHTVLSKLTTSLHGLGNSSLNTPRIAVDRARNRVFVGDGQTVWTIDGKPGSATFNQIIATTVVTTDPELWVVDLAVNSVNARVYVKVSSAAPLGTGAARLMTLNGDTSAVIGAMNLPGRHFGGFVAVDPARERVFVAPGWFGTGLDLAPNILVVNDPVLSQATVTSGAPVVTPQAVFQFQQVVSPGNVTVEQVEPTELPTPLPGQFTIEGGLAYNITATATVQGLITSCFNASHISDPTTFAALRVLHGENGAWVDRTTSRDFATGSICAQTSSLSPFVVVSLDVDYQVSELYDATKAVKAGSTIPLKIQLIAPWGANLSAPGIIVTATSLKKLSDTASFVVQDAGQSNADSNFRFDATVGPGGGYIFNLQTKGLTTGTYELEFTATGDRTIHKLRFQVR